MTKEQAERLEHNDDWQAFKKLLLGDVECWKDELIGKSDITDIIKIQTAIKTVRAIIERPAYVIADATDPEQ